VSTDTALAERIASRIDPAGAANIVVSDNGGGLVFTNALEMMDFAKLMAVSDKAVRPHLRNNPGACLGIIVQANDWGMSPYAVANKSYLVNDQFAYESQLIQAVILKRAPIKGRIKFAYEGEGDQRICIASAIGLDGETVEYRSPPLGKITPKNSPLWKNDPDQQLSYYCGRALCRRHFPDVLLGVYAEDELDGAAPIKDVTPQPTGLAARLAAKPAAGFDAAAVNAATGGAPAVVESAPPSGDEAEKASATHDPELMRAGAQAFIDGESPMAPGDLSDEQAAAWFKGYDQAKASAQEGGAS